jgi:outer membrane receptor protein involved in Fe transport
MGRRSKCLPTSNLRPSFQELSISSRRPVSSRAATRNNRSQADGTYYLGPGTTPAYGIVNVGARYQLNKWLQVVAQINNLFDRHYYTASQLQGTGFTNTGNNIARPLPVIGGEFPMVQAAFYAPGAPTTYCVGTRLKF